MLTRKGNLICKALVFAFAVITAMTMDSCCDDCLGGSKSNNNPKLIINNPKPGRTETSNEDKETAGFRKIKDGNLWIFGTPLFYSAKEGWLRVVGKKLAGTFPMSEYIIHKYLIGFNSNYKNITKIEGVSEVSGEVNVCKIVIIGDTEVGKTQIFNRERGESFTDIYMANIGAEFFNKFLDINNNAFRLTIWDTPGQREIVKNHTNGFLEYASIIILVYDVTIEEISKSLDYWYGEINAKATPGTAIFVVGNKCDLTLIESDAVNKVNNWINSKCEQKQVLQN